MPFSVELLIEIITIMPLNMKNIFKKRTQKQNFFFKNKNKKWNYQASVAVESHGGGPTSMVQQRLDLYGRGGWIVFLLRAYHFTYFLLSI